MSSITLMEKLTRNLEHIDRPRENLKPHNGPIPSSAPFPPQGRLPPHFQSDLGRSPVLLWTAHSAALRRWPRPASPGAARGRVRCPAAPGLPGGPHCAWERPGGVRRCLRRPPSPALGSASWLGVPRSRDGMQSHRPVIRAQRERLPCRLLALPPAPPAPLAARAQPRGGPHLEAGS